MDDHISEKPFECDICKKTFSDYYTMKLHIMSYIRKGLPFKCPVCPEDFSRFSDLKEHMRIHPEFKPFKCQHCKKRFSKNCDLSAHMLTHESKKSFVWDDCFKCFLNSSNLRSDKEEYLNKKIQKPYACKICAKKFFEQRYRNLHMRKHIGERVLSCDFCKKTFTSEGYLAKHMICHSKLKDKYFCPFCQRSFIRTVNLKRHMRRHTCEKSIDQGLIFEKKEADSILKTEMKMEVENRENKNLKNLEETCLKSRIESEDDILFSMKNEPCVPLDLSFKKWKLKT